MILYVCIVQYMWSLCIYTESTAINAYLLTLTPPHLLVYTCIYRAPPEGHDGQHPQEEYPPRQGLNPKTGLYMHTLNPKIFASFGLGTSVI